MNEELIKKMDDYIRERLTEKRYRHTLGVVETATALAEQHGADEEKALTAALFHDACKNLDSEEMNMLVEKYDIGEVYIDKPQLAHSKLAAAIIKDRFGVDDEDIINAISFHTTGREGMSLLEKIIYVADATEPNRTYKDAKRLNALAFKNLDQACFEVAEWSLKIIKDEGRYLDADTVKARDWFEKILKGNSMENSRKFAEFAAGVLSDRQGRDIVIIDIMEKSSFADYFVIATGSSERMINALAEYVDDKSAAEGRFTKNIEGRNGSGWVLMDYGDVVINIFSEENRQKYNLEKIWSDCEIINWEDK
jgi:ribosome silencing factor RsfS/YbeB/iojap